jgi:hypothetical protein
MSRLGAISSCTSQDHANETLAAVAALDTPAPIFSLHPRLKHSTVCVVLVALLEVCHDVPPLRDLLKNTAQFTSRFHCVINFFQQIRATLRELLQQGV